MTVGNGLRVRVRIGVGVGGVFLSNLEQNI